MEERRVKTIKYLIAFLVVAVVAALLLVIATRDNSPIDQPEADIFLLNGAEYAEMNDQALFEECYIMGEKHYVTVLQVRNVSDTTGTFALTARFDERAEGGVVFGYAVYDAAPYSAESALVEGEFNDIIWNDDNTARLYSAPLSSGEAYYIAVAVKTYGEEISYDSFAGISFAVVNI